MKSLLFALPSDVAISILRDWLEGFKNIVKLDLICGASCRADFLALLRSPGFRISDMTSGCRAGGRHVAAYIDWINARQIEVDALYVSMGSTRRYMRIKKLASVRSLWLTEATWNEEMWTVSPPTDTAVDIKHLCMLLSMLPMLTSVAVMTTDGDQYVDLLTTMTHLPLESISLDDDPSTKNSLSNVIALVDVFCGTLKVLNLGSREASFDVLQHICRVCTLLEVLSCNLDGLSYDDALLVFEFGMLPQLQRISVNYSHMSDELAVSMCSNFPLLKSATFEGSNTEPSLSACGRMITCNPRLKTLYTPVCRVFASEAARGVWEASYAKLEFYRKHSSELFATELPKITANCRNANVCSIKYTYVELDPLIFAIIVLSYGANLLELECSLDDTVGDKSYILLAVTCVKLRRLRLLRCRGIMDTGLIAIGDHCHDLHELKLATAHVFDPCEQPATELGFTSLFERIGSHLNILAITLTRLTRSLLDAITVNLFYLTSLAVQDTYADTAETCSVFIDQLIMPNHLPKLTRFHIGYSTHELLLRVKKLDGVDRRWRRMLAGNVL